MAPAFLTMRRRFWLRTLLEAVGAAVFFGPIALELIRNPFFGHALHFLYLPALLLWGPFFSHHEGYMVWPHLLATAFFVLHTALARDRFPKPHAVVRAVRPFVVALFLGYVLAGWSQFVGDEVAWRDLAMYGLSPNFAEAPGAVMVNGFPMKFSIQDWTLSGSSVTPYFLFVPLLFDTLFYASLLLLLRQACKKIVKRTVSEDERAGS